MPSYVDNVYHICVSWWIENFKCFWKNANDHSSNVPEISAFINLVEDFKKWVQCWKETTSTSPSGRHLGHYKTAILDDRWRNYSILVDMINFPITHGFALDRWTHSATPIICMSLLAQTRHLPRDWNPMQFQNIHSQTSVISNTASIRDLIPKRQYPNNADCITTIKDATHGISRSYVSWAC